MWAQMITVRLKPGKEDQLERLVQQLEATEQPGSGRVRSTAMREENDPRAVYMMVVFESEEKARAREQDPRRQEGLAKVGAIMADICEGPIQFTNLTVVAEHMS